MRTPSVRRPLAVSLSRLSSALAVCAALGLAKQNAEAIDFHWDPGLDGDGVVGGGGIWNLTDTFWDPTGTDPMAADNVIWPNLDTSIAIFGGLGGIVTIDNLAAGVNAGGLTFNTDGYFISSFTDALNLGGATPTIAVTNVGTTATIEASITGLSGLTKTGAGTLTLTGFNSFTGNINVSAGALDFNADTALGDVANGINLTNGGRINFTGGAQWDPAATRVINIGTGGGTIGSTIAIRLTDVGQLTGAGTLTREATGTGFGLDIQQANLGFTGNTVINSGVIEFRDSQALGNTVGQTVTVNGGRFVIAIGPFTGNFAPTLSQPVTLNGGALGFGNQIGGQYAGNVNVTADSEIILNDFYQSANRGGAITGVLSGTNRLTVSGVTGGFVGGTPNIGSVLLTNGGNTYSGTIAINGGAHVRAVQGGGVDALASASIELNGGGLGLAPVANAAGASSGLFGRYYNSAKINNGVAGGFDFGTEPLALSRTDATIDYLATAPTGTGVNGTNMTALWTGILEVTTGGTYSFSFRSDDGSMIYVNGQQIVANDFSQGVNERFGSINLAPGFHPIIVKYAQGGGSAAAQAFYNGPDTGNTKVILGSVGGTLTNNGDALFAPTTMNNNITVNFGGGDIDLAGANATSSGTVTFAPSASLRVTGVTGFETLTQTGAVTLDGTNTITTGITLANNQTNTHGHNSSGADLVISGNIGEATPGSALFKSGPRRLTLTGTNSFTGGIFIDAGTLAGTVAAFNSNNITNSGTLIFQQATDASFSGTLIGGGAVRKEGAGRLTLTDNSGVATGLFTVAEGTLAGTSAYGGAVSVAPLAALAASSGATFEIGALTLTGGSLAGFALGAPTLTPAINANGQLTVGGVALNFTNAGGLAAGTFRLVDYTGVALTPQQFAGMNVGAVPAGFFIGLINNAANTSVDATVETANAFNNWTGAINGVWDTGATANWSSGTFAAGQQAVFGAGATNRTITGPTVAPQSVTVDTSTGNYSIANNFSGTVAGGINKNGAGTLTLTGTSTGSGQVTINAGTLSVAATNAGSALGTGAVRLNGGVLSVVPTVTNLAPGLRGTYFNGGAGSTSAKDYDPANYTAERVGTRLEGGLAQTFVENTPPAGYLGGNPGLGVGTDENTGAANSNVTNFGAVFAGKFFAPVAGEYTFSTSSDDSTRILIDGVPVIFNEGGQGGQFVVSRTITLSAGYHEIRQQFAQATGGSNVRLYTPNGVSVLGLSEAETVTLGNSLLVTANATVDLAGSNFTTAGFGVLKMDAGTALTVAGQAGKMLEFGGTVANGAGTFTLNSVPDVRLGVVSLPGSTLNKLGSGRLYLDNTTATANDFTGSTINVQAGALVLQGSSFAGSTNPLGTGSVSLSGGTLVVDSKFGAVTYANNVTLTVPTRIESVPSAVTVTLGGAANTFALGANDLTVDTFAGGAGSTQGGANLSIGNAAGSTLTLGGTLTGSGNIIKTSSFFNDANVIVTNRNPGTLNFTGNSPAFSGNIAINVGAVTGTGQAAAAPKPLGTGAITITTQDPNTGFAATTNPGNAVALGASLNLRGNSTGSATTTVFGNALNLVGVGSQVTIDVNNAGANTNNTIQLGALTIGGSVTRLNVTGGNTYYVGFDPTIPTMLPAGGFTVAATTGNVRFGQNLTTAGTLTKVGQGILRLDGTNTLGAVVVRSGLLALTNQAAIPGTVTLSGNTITTVGGPNASGLILSGAGGSFANNATPNNNLLSFTATSNYALRFDNSLGDVSNAGGRWGDTTPLALTSSIGNADSLSLIGNATTDYTETVGPISYTGGVIVGLRTNFANRTTTFTTPSLTRVARGTMELATGASALGLGAAGTVATALHSFGGTTAGALFVVSGTEPARGTNLAATTVNMVTPTIINATTSNFVDYAPGDTLGFQDAFYDSFDLDSSLPNSIVTSGASVLSGDRPVYALKLTGALTSSTGGTQRVVTISGDQSPGNDGTAGLILNNGSNFTGTNADVKLVFGSLAEPREAVIHIQAGNHTLAGPILANGLTKHGQTALLLTTDQSRNGSGATLTGLEGDIVLNRGIISLRSQNGAGRGGTGLAGSGTTRLVLAGGILETRFDTATTFGAGSGGTAYDVVVRANSTINPDRAGTTNNITHTFGNLSFEPTADHLRIAAGSGHRIVFGGTNAINLPNSTTFDVQDNANNATLGGTINSATVIITRGQLTGGPNVSLTKTGSGKWQASAGGQSMTFGGGTRIEQGAVLFEYNPASAVAETVSFGSGPITINGQGSFGIFGNAGAGAATTVVEFNNPVNIVEFGGGLHLINNTANQQLRYTGAINLAGPMLIGNGGGATAGNNPQYGSLGGNLVTIDQNTAGSRMIVMGGNKDIDFNGNIVDGAGAAGNELVMQVQSGNVLNINGTANTYSGGTRILGATSGAGTPQTGRVLVSASSVLGTGDVFIDGGFLALDSLSNVAPGRTITMTPAYGSSGVLLFRNLDPSQAQLAALIDPDSRGGVIALSTGTPTTQALNFGALGDGTLFLGASLTATTYNAATLGVGAANTYRVGGGYNTLTIANPAGNIFTGANSVLVGSGLYGGGFGNTGGNLVVNGANDYSGGTVVNFGSGTFTVAGAGGLGSGPLSSYGGTTTINAAQTIASVSISGGTVNANAANALGAVTNDIVLGLGTHAAAAQAALNFNTAEQTYDQLTVAGNAIVRPNVGTIFTSGLNFPQTDTNLNVNGQNVLILSAPAIGSDLLSNTVTVTLATQSVSGAARSANTALAVSNMNQLPTGNLNLNGGVLILDNTGLGGRLIGGTGPNQIQINTPTITGNATNGTQTGTTFWNQNLNFGGGFAARGTPVTITGADLVTPNAFDTNFTLGNSATVGGQLYANAPITLAVDTTLTARRSIVIGRTGPGLTRKNDAPNVVINRITGNFSGSGSLTFHSNTASNVANDPMAEVVLSGSISYTGSPTEDTDGGGASRWISAGPGGLIVSTGSGNPAESGDIFVRFNGQASLPTGNGGTNPAYLLANRYAGSGVLPFRTGFLFTGEPGGVLYRLNNLFKMALNGNNGTGAPVAATFGSTGGAATLRDSIIALIGGLNTSTAAASTGLLVRDGTFTLGTTGGSPDGAVRFQPANFDIPTADNTDPGIASAATNLSNNTGNRTIQVRGVGTAIIGNVAYRNVLDAGDTSGQFFWQLGAGSAGVAEGFVRETTDVGATGNLSNVRVTMNGGVMEFASTPRSIILGTGIGFVAMTGTAGGGFAAVGGERSLTIAGGPLAFNSTGSFLTGTAPLIFGSPNADSKLTLTNSVDLNGAARSFATIDGVGVGADGEISGSIAGNASSVFNLNALNQPDGTPHVAGSLILSGDSTGYLGSTNVNAGTLQVNGILPGNLAVNNGGTLGGSGTVGTVTVNAGGTLAPGASPGILTTTGSLTFAPTSTFSIEINTATAGTGYDRVATGGDVTLGGATLTLGGSYNLGASGDIFTIILNGGINPVTGTFAGLPNGEFVTLGSQFFQISYFDNPATAGVFELAGGNSVSLQAVIPEPGSALTLLAGSGSLLSLSRFRRRKGR